MFKRIFVLAVWLALASPAAAQPPRVEGAVPVKAAASSEVPGLKLTPDQTVTVKKKVVVVKAELEEGSKERVRWLLDNQNPDSEPDFLELPASNSVLVFLSGEPDMIVVRAVVKLKDGALSEFARSVITVEGHGPAPKPKPDPDPKPPNPDPKPADVVKQVKGPVHVTLILDFTQQTAELASVVNDGALQKWLGDGGYRRHVVSTKSRSVTQDGLGDGLSKAGGAPAIVIQDGDGHILDQGRLTDADSVRKLASKYKGV